MVVPNYTNVDAVLKDVFSLGKSAAKIAKVGAIPVENDIMKESVLPVVGSLSAFFKVDTDIVGCKQRNAFDKYIYNRTTGKPQILTLAKAFTSFVKLAVVYLRGIGVVFNVFKQINAILTIFEICVTTIGIVVKCFNDPAFVYDVKKHGISAVLYPILSAFVCSIVGLCCKNYAVWLMLGVGMHFAQRFLVKSDCQLISDVVTDTHVLLKFPLLFTKYASSGFAIVSTMQLGIGMLPIITKLTVNACRWLSGYLGSSFYQLQPVFNVAA